MQEIFAEDQLHITRDTTERPVLFACLTGTIFVAISSFLVALDAVPEVRVRAAENTVGGVATSTRTMLGRVASDVADTETRSRVPIRVTVRSVAIDTNVMTPSNDTVAALDQALFSGAVHYPGSAAAGERGTVLLFGHSSHLPIVKNKAFKAFNGLEDVRRGDVISVYSTTHRYEYRVTSIRLTTADAAVVQFDVPGAQLVLSTCNTFGDKQERWVATAEFVQDMPIVQ